MIDLNSFTRNLIMGGLRKAFSRSPQAKECRLLAKHPTEVGIRGGARFICNGCGLPFGARDVSVDHIDPMIPPGLVAAEMEWNEIIARLFCPVSNLQALCKGCHDAKTKEEQGERVVTRRAWKKKVKAKQTLWLGYDDLFKKYQKDEPEVIEIGMFKKSSASEENVEDFGWIIYTDNDGVKTPLK